MKIDDFSISNFRQHRAVEVKLPDAENSLVLIRGLNGTGKTNLLKALTWGLTGALGPREPRFTPASLASFSTISSSNDGDTFEVAVELGITLSKGKSARVRRSVPLTKAGSDLSAGNPSLQVLTEQSGKGWEKEHDPELWLENYLPERFSHYFLFDGEQLENFFRASESKFVQNAMLEIAQIDHLERMAERLASVESDLTRSVGSKSKKNPEEDLGLQFEQIEQQINSATKKIAQHEEDLEKAEAAQLEARARYGEVREAQGEVRRRQQLEEDVSKAEKRSDEAALAYVQWSVRAAPLALAKSALDLLTAQIDRAREEKELPPPYDPEALRQLIGAERCVCGTSLGSGSSERQHIEHLIEEFQALSSRGELLQRSEGPLSRLGGRLQELSSSYGRLANDLEDAQKEFEAKSVTLETLKKKMAGHDDEQIAVISQALDLAQEATSSAKAGLALTKNTLQNAQRNKAELQKKIDAESKQDENLSKLRKHVLFAREVESAASTLLEDLKNQVRQTVSETLNSRFQSMIWKKDAFEPVEIDEEYRVRVVNRQGFENRSGLSAGETACLAFAFSLTLSDVSGASYPMVVDSPLGRLSGDVKKSVSEVLVKAVQMGTSQDPRQLIMFMTDEEFDEEVQRVFAAESPALFEIAFDQELSEAELRAV